MPTALLTAPNVRAARAAIRGAEPLRLSALLDLHLVGERLALEGLPDTIAGREWALGRVLAEAVETALGTSGDGPRTSEPASSRAGLERALADGDLDAQAWWMLWLRFLDGRGVAAGAIARQLGVEPRTLQRRIQRGCRLLAAHLLDSEAQLDARVAENEASAAAAPSSSAPGAMADPRPPGSPPHSSATAPLPPERDAYVTRPEPHEALEALCRSHRLVTLVGPGGAGKTRLAVHAAGTLVATDGPFVPLSFVSLEGLQPHDSVVDELCRALAIEVRRSPGEEMPDETRLQALTRTMSTRGGLLVLDNCEHVSTAVADVVDHLLEHCPPLRILATSRRPLDLAAEQRLPLGPMTMPATEETTEHDSEAVALFLARARSIDPTLELDTRTGPLIAGICRAVDGLPLAVEIAAAGLEHLSLPLLAEAIEQDLPALRHPGLDTPERQRSLSAAVRWSTDRLAEGHRGALLALSIFEGGFTAEAASAVLAPRAASDVRDVLRTLVRRSLLVPPSTVAGDRFRLLRPVRATVRAQLEEEAPRVRERIEEAHARHFADWLHECTPALQGDRATETLVGIDAASSDIHIALERVMSRDPRLALRIAGGMSDYWLMRGHVREGRRLLAQALGGAPDAPLEHRVPALLGLARLARQASDPAAASRVLDEAIELLRRTDDRRATADALREAGTVREQQRDVVGAAEAYRESLMLYHAEGDAFGEAAVHNNVGLLAHHEGDFDIAAQRLAQSLHLFRSIKARRETGIVLANLANVRGDRGDLTLAAANYAEALAIASAFGDHAGRAAILPSMAWVKLQQGDDAGATKALADAIPPLFRVEDRRKAAEWLGCAAAILTRHEDDASASVALSAEAALRARIGADVLPKERAERAALQARLEARTTREQRRAWQETGQSLPWQEALLRTLRALRERAGDRPG